MRKLKERPTPASRIIDFIRRETDDVLTYQERWDYFNFAFDPALEEKLGSQAGLVYGFLESEDGDVARTATALANYIIASQEDLETSNVAIAGLIMHDALLIQSEILLDQSVMFPSSEKFSRRDVRQAKQIEKLALQTDQNARAHFMNFVERYSPAEFGEDFALKNYFTVTLLARFRGISGSNPLFLAA